MGWEAKDCKMVWRSKFFKFGLKCLKVATISESINFYNHYSFNIL